MNHLHLISDPALKLTLYNYSCYYYYYDYYQKLTIPHVLITYQKSYICLGLIIAIGMFILPYKVGAKIEIPNSLILRYKLYEMRPFLVMEGLTCTAVRGMDACAVCTLYFPVSMKDRAGPTHLPTECGRTR